MSKSEKIKWVISGIWGVWLTTIYLLAVLWPVHSITGITVICMKIIIFCLLFIVLFGNRLEKIPTQLPKEVPKILFYDNHFARALKNALDIFTNGPEKENGKNDAENGKNTGNDTKSRDGIHDAPPESK